MYMIGTVQHGFLKGILFGSIYFEQTGNAVALAPDGNTVIFGSIRAQNGNNLNTGSVEIHGMVRNGYRKEILYMVLIMTEIQGVR